MQVSHGGTCASNESAFVEASKAKRYASIEEQIRAGKDPEIIVGSPNPKKHLESNQNAFK